MKIKLGQKKYFNISIDTFDVDISFFINYSYEEMLEYTKRKKLKILNEYLQGFNDYEEEYGEEEDGVEARMYPLKQGYAVRFKFYKDSFRLNLSNVCHEINHLVNWILMDRRINLTKDNDEVFAYLTEEIINKFLFKWY